MLLVQLLLPRFLVVEVVLFIHFMEGSVACKPKSKSPKDSSNRQISTCFIPIGGPQSGQRPIQEEPLIYDLQGEIIFPSKNDSSGSQPRVQIQDQAFLSCPSAKLASIGSGAKDVIQVKCQSDNQLTYEGQSLSLQDLSCSESIVESIVETGISCGPSDAKGKIAHIGWKMRDQFTPQITVCHDRKLGHSYFTNHTLRGTNSQEN